MCGWFLLRCVVDHNFFHPTFTKLHTYLPYSDVFRYCSLIIWPLAATFPCYIQLKPNLRALRCIPPQCKCEHYFRCDPICSSSSRNKNFVTSMLMTCDSNRMNWLQGSVKNKRERDSVWEEFSVTMIKWSKTRTRTHHWSQWNQLHLLTCPATVHD